MADKVKLTPPMTDSKTPEWAREQAEDVHIMLVATKEANIETISQALLSAYERGRKEGIEGAAKVLEAVSKTYLPGGPMDAKGGLLLGATAIRHLLEVKKDIDAQQDTK